MAPTLAEPFAKAQMLIRRPVHEVFEAFVDPKITSKFWFTKSSGRLEAGKRVRWDWEMYGASVHVRVKVFEEDRRLVLESTAAGEVTTIELLFTPAGDGAFVSVAESGGTAAGAELLARAIDQTEGWALVLAALKALLEHGVILRVVADHHPREARP